MLFSIEYSRKFVVFAYMSKLPKCMLVFKCVSRKGLEDGTYL